MIVLYGRTRGDMIDYRVLLFIIRKSYMQM